MKLYPILLALAVAGIAVAHAQSAPTAQPQAKPAAKGAQELLSEGEVRKVHREAGKVTLRHGPLKNLDMPAMTMVFTVADPKLLDGLHEGDKVRFTASQKDGNYFVVALHVVH